MLARIDTLAERETVCCVQPVQPPLLLQVGPQATGGTGFAPATAGTARAATSPSMRSNVRKFASFRCLCRQRYGENTHVSVPLPCQVCVRAKRALQLGDLAAHGLEVLIVECERTKRWIQMECLPQVGKSGLMPSCNRLVTRQVVEQGRVLRGRDHSEERVGRASRVATFVVGMRTSLRLPAAPDRDEPPQFDDRLRMILHAQVADTVDALA